MLATRWGRWWAAISLLALVAAGCGSRDGEHSGPSGPAATSLTTAPPPPVAASDCSSSDVELEPATAVPDVTFVLRTDRTRTSLLMTNTGVLIAVVVPGADGTTQLREAFYANPTDEASVVALDAVANSGFATRVEGLPAGLPPNQVYVVPPGWSVCALSGRLGVSASTLYLRD